jgi:hypothetical protein
MNKRQKIIRRGAKEGKSTRKTADKRGIHQMSSCFLLYKGIELINDEPLPFLLILDKDKGTRYLHHFLFSRLSQGI